MSGVPVQLQTSDSTILDIIPLRGRGEGNCVVSARSLLLYLTCSMLGWTCQASCSVLIGLYMRRLSVIDNMLDTMP